MLGLLACSEAYEFGQLNTWSDNALFQRRMGSVLKKTASLRGYHKAASTRGLLRVGLLTLKMRDFEVSSPEVSTRIFISVGVLTVSCLPGIIRCGLCLNITPMDTAMKQALLGIIGPFGLGD